MIDFRKLDIIRVLKVIGGTTGIILAFTNHSVILGVFGGLFLFQGLTNTGCGVCTTSSCTINSSKKNKEQQ